MTTRTINSYRHGLVTIEAWRRLDAERVFEGFRQAARGKVITQRLNLGLYEIFTPAGGRFKVDNYEGMASGWEVFEWDASRFDWTEDGWTQNVPNGDWVQCDCWFDRLADAKAWIVGLGR
jgi:hypothetical protein